MNQIPFIFSNERRYRIQRHLAFWLFWGVFQGLLYAFVPIYNTGYFHRLPQTMLDSVLFLPNHIFFSYSLMYFVIPAYVVKNKYKLAAIWMAVLVVATACTSALVSLYLIVPMRALVLPASFVISMPMHNGERNLFYMAMLAGLRGGITIGGLAAAIKLMKHWYVEGQRNLQLQKEAVESQLKLLRAQVHPHFLFNTLNNIYSHTQATSPTASRLVMGLSDMLRYMLYECNQPLAPLGKELKMLEDYIALENIRYGNKLELHVDFPVDASEFYVAPLLLLAFVENAFKHGISNMLQHPWLNLSVSLKDNTMTFKLLNSKPEHSLPSQRVGIGIENVRKRLALLYPSKHELLITADNEVFIVNLKLELEKRTGTALTVVQPTVAAAVA
jgi:sensor histidine kinase YesM